MFWSLKKLSDGSFSVRSQCLEFELTDECEAELLVSVMNLLDRPDKKTPFIIRARARTAETVEHNPRNNWEYERIRFVRLFQQTFGLNVDGMPGELTFRKLSEVTAWAKQLGNGWVVTPKNCTCQESPEGRIANPQCIAFHMTPAVSVMTDPP